VDKTSPFINEVNNGSHLQPDPKCTCSRFGFPGEYPGTSLFLFVICELIFQAHSFEEGKLRTYLKIKTNFGYENYLSIIKNFE
jgi:hypothetical protein